MMTGNGTRLGLIAACAVITSGAAAETPDGSNFKWDAGPVFKGDGWEIRLGGQVQGDYAFVDADISGAEWSEGELRRLRLHIAGEFGSNFKYKVELNTNSSDDVNVEDAYGQWTPTGGGWNIKAGQFKTPNSLDEQTSSRFISVLERAAFTDAFQFQRQLGVSVNASGDHYTLSAGVFVDNINMTDVTDSQAFAARTTFVPINRDDVLVHMGGSIRYRRINASQSDIRYRQRPVSHIPGRIISTGGISDSDLFIGVEAAALVKNFWFAGEYGVTFANCSAAATASGACINDRTLDGAYGEIGVVFGGKKTYKGGKFARPKIDNPATEGGMGALAFVARIDTISFNDSGLNGGGFNSYILGGDWWATKYSRLGVNFFKVNADLGASTSGLDSNFAALVTASAFSEDVKGVIFRAQLDF